MSIPCPSHVYPMPHSSPSKPFPSPSPSPSQSTPQNYDGLYFVLRTASPSVTEYSYFVPKISPIFYGYHYNLIHAFVYVLVSSPPPSLLFSPVSSNTEPSILLIPRQVVRLFVTSIFLGSSFGLCFILYSPFDPFPVPSFGLVPSLDTTSTLNANPPRLRYLSAHRRPPSRYQSTLHVSPDLSILLLDSLCSCKLLSSHSFQSYILSRRTLSRLVTHFTSTRSQRETYCSRYNII